MTSPTSPTRTTVEEMDGTTLVAAEDTGVPKDVQPSGSPPPPTREDLEAKKKVPLRIPESFIVLARVEWASTTGGGEKVQHQCEQLLEKALADRAAEAHARALAAANRVLHEQPDPLVGMPELDPEEPTTQVNAMLSRYARLIAADLALTEAGPGSIQRICEPLLCQALEANLLAPAIEDASRLLNDLKRRRKGIQQKKRKGS